MSVRTCVRMCICPTPLLRGGCDTSSLFKQSTAALNSEPCFPLNLSDCLTLLVREERDRFMFMHVCASACVFVVVRVCFVLHTTDLFILMLFCLRRYNHSFFFFFLVILNFREQKLLSVCFCDKNESEKTKDEFERRYIYIFFFFFLLDGN